jgi:chromosome partitioning protein
MAKPKVVGVVSQKGGVGKSTLCQLIAREAAISGKNAKILDFDVKQMTSTDWVRARMERDIEPAIEAEPAKDVKKAVKHSRGYDIILLDGSPGAPKRTAELLAVSDMIILPTGASRADLVPSLALARRIADMNLTTDGPVFALCRVMTASETAEARSAIRNAGFETLDGELIERVGYRQAQNIGRSPTETIFTSLNSLARALARSVLDRLAWNAIEIKRR